MAGVIATNPRYQFFRTTPTFGPAVNYRLYTYDTGTNTPATTWQDEALSIANTNPIILDSRGEAVIWLDPTKQYRFQLRTNLDAVVWTQDDVYGAFQAINGLDASQVRYTPAGTGAVATTVEAKLRQVANVKDFGAMGDGVTDDTAAIKLAFAHGLSVYFPEGIYIVNDKIDTQFDGQVIHGDGGKASIIKYGNLLDAFVVYGRRVGIFTIVTKNVEVRDLYIDNNFRGSGRNDTQEALINCVQVPNNAPFGLESLYVHDCTFYDIYGNGIETLDRCSNTRFVNNTMTTTYIVQGWTTAGVKGQQCISTGGDFCLVQGNTLFGALDDAIAIHKETNKCIVSDNVITTTGGRILIAGCTQVICHGNSITYIETGSAAISVNLEGVSIIPPANFSVSICDNNVYVNPGVDLGQAIQYVGGGGDVLISGNVLIQKNTGTRFGITVSVASFVLPSTGVTYNYGIDGIKVTNNYCRGWDRGISWTDNASFPVINGDISENYLLDCTTGVFISAASQDNFIGNNKYKNCTTSTNGNLRRISENAVTERVYFSGSYTGNTTVDLTKLGMPAGYIYRPKRLMGYLLEGDKAPTGANITVTLLRADLVTVVSTATITTGATTPNVQLVLASGNFDNEYLYVRVTSTGVVTNTVNLALTASFVGAA